MSASLNRITLIGTLGRDPEVRQTSGGQSVAGFTMATNETWTDKQGKKQERTEWHRIVAYGRLAELCGEYLAKGRQVYVEGRIQTREWQDKDGGQRKTTEVIASAVKFLGGARDGGQRRQAIDDEGSLPGPVGSRVHDDGEDKVPF